MHYCFLTISNIDGAGYMRAVNLGKALLDRGVQVSYVLDDTPINRSFTRLDVRATASFVGPRRHPFQISRRRRAIRALQPDFVEVLTPHPKTLLPLMGIRGPKVVAIWDEPAFLKSLPFMRLAYETRLASWLVRRADYHFAATARLKEQMHARFGIEATYMPHATYLTDYPPATSPYERPTAAFMGNFFKDWDHDVIFEAMKILADRGKKYDVVLMGTGPDEARWQEFCKTHGLNNVRFLGFTTGVELWRHLRHAHLLLFPIRSTLGNWVRCPSKTFAYAQARRPILTSPVGEVAEVLGSGATYIDSSPGPFAEAIDQAMSQLALPDVDYGIERHNWGARCDTLLEALKR